MIPLGTVTAKDVADAAVTLAFTAPKKTILFVGVALKFVPVIVTDVPTGPEVGEKELMVGCAKTAEAKKIAIKRKRCGL